MCKFIIFYNIPENGLSVDSILINLPILKSIFLMKNSHIEAIQPDLLAIIVIVLYKTLPEESPTIKSFVSLKSIWNDFPYKVLIYNNSPENHIESTDDYEVVNAGQNDMLSGAYNHALKIATDENIPWIVLFDQDTVLDKTYLTELQEKLAYFQNTDSAVSAIMPCIYVNKEQVSPQIYNPKFYFSYTATNMKPNVVSHDCILAFNSGIALKTKAMNEIGGFSNKYPLDSQDHDYMYRLYKKGYSTYSMNARLNHDLSMSDYSKMSISRYQSIIDAENEFSKDCGILNFLSYKFWLFLRFTKWIFKADKRPFACKTLKKVFKL